MAEISWHLRDTTSLDFGAFALSERDGVSHEWLGTASLSLKAHGHMLKLTSNKSSSYFWSNFSFGRRKKFCPLFPKNDVVLFHMTWHAAVKMIQNEMKCVQKEDRSNTMAVMKSKFLSDEIPSGLISAWIMKMTSSKSTGTPFCWNWLWFLARIWFEKKFLLSDKWSKNSFLLHSCYQILLYSV